MKFSIIVPVYNVEKYISKCLESLEKQTFKDFEVIVVNDGTKDNSQEIIDKYVEKRPDIFKSYIKENGGLSDARNFGIAKSVGEYILFLDSDDWIDNNLLEVLNREIEENDDLDLIRIPKKTIHENKETIIYEKQEYKKLTGEEAFVYLRQSKKCIETAWSYCVNSNFWKKNNFKFPKGMFHEDFATMLIVLLKANKILFIKDVYYNYVVRENSIMTNKNYENELKKALDKLEHYDKICKELKKINTIQVSSKEICLEYISTAICFGIKNLKKQDKKAYRKKLKERNVFKNIQSNSLREFVRKTVLFMMVNL